MVMRAGADFAGGIKQPSTSIGILKNNGFGTNLNGGTVPAPTQRAPKPLYGGTVPSPAQRAPSGPTYTPPPQQMVYTDPRITNPNDNWAQPLGGGGAAQNSFDGGGIGGAPQAPQGPAQGGRQWYESLGAPQKQAEDAKYLGGDSDYQAQLGEYDRALSDFVKRISGQIDNFNDDAKLATDATNKNMDMSQDQLGEDFGARGMSYSGLFTKSKADMTNRFTDQVKNIDLVRGRNVSDANNRQKDYESENQIGRGNAKRSALARMMANQSLIDSGTMF